MTKPTVDDDPAVSAAITRDLRRADPSVAHAFRSKQRLQEVLVGGGSDLLSDAVLA